MKRPSDYQLTSQLAGLIDCFLTDADNMDELNSDRLCVVVKCDYRTIISAMKGDCLVAVPLKALSNYIRPNVLADLEAKHVGIDFAAMHVMRELKIAEITTDWRTRLRAFFGQRK
jgi:hypothetical protein